MRHKNIIDAIQQLLIAVSKINRGYQGECLTLQGCQALLGAKHCLERSNVGIWFVQIFGKTATLLIEIFLKTKFKVKMENTFYAVFRMSVLTLYTISPFGDSGSV